METVDALSLEKFETKEEEFRERRDAAENGETKAAETMFIVIFGEGRSLGFAETCAARCHCVKNFAFHCVSRQSGVYVRCSSCVLKN